MCWPVVLHVLPAGDRLGAGIRDCLLFPLPLAPSFLPGCGSEGRPKFRHWDEDSLESGNECSDEEGTATAIMGAGGASAMSSLVLMHRVVGCPGTIGCGLSAFTAYRRTLCCGGRRDSSGLASRNREGLVVGWGRGPYRATSR